MLLRLHQCRQDETRQNSRGRSAECDLIRNDEMLEVDESGGDQQRNENPVGDRDVPGKGAPDCEEQERGQEFDGEIAEGDAIAAIRAASRARKAN